MASLGTLAVVLFLALSLSTGVASAAPVEVADCRTIDDWRSGDVDTQLLRDVIDAWRTGDPVE